MANAEMLKGHINWVEDMSTPQSILDADTSFLVGRVVVRVNDGSTEVTTLGVNGGASRLALGGDDADAGQFHGPLAIEPDESPSAAMQTRFRVTDVSVASVYVGFTDQNASSEVPIEDEDGALNTNATDAMGLLLEGEQDVTWQTVGVQNNTDNAQAASSNISDLTDSEWTTVRVQISPADSGTMKAIVDGVDLITANTTSTVSTGNNVTTSFFRSSIVYCPVLSGDDRSTAYNIDVAEIGWWGNTGATFD